MLIRLGYDIRFEVYSELPMMAMLKVHPSRAHDLLEPDTMHVEPNVAVDDYIDGFGNICSRLVAPPGVLRMWTSNVIRDSGLPDPQNPSARQLPVEELPPDVLRFLLGSRYCEVDRLSDLAISLFGQTTPGWPRVQAVLDWVHQRTTFGYNFARSTKTALDVYNEQTGVCRDFQHLAIAMCRSLNIPARYATGYLGDIGVTVLPVPGDFSAWFEAYLDGRWWTFDARHNMPRIGRVLMATGLDAADVAITTAFGNAFLAKFEIITDLIEEQAVQPDRALTAS